MFAYSTLIKKLRLSNGLSQTDLAKLTGYKDRTSISKIESGKIDLPQSKIIEFAKVLNVSPVFLMGWNDENENVNSNLDNLHLKICVLHIIDNFNGDQIKKVIDYAKYLKSQEE